MIVLPTLNPAGKSRLKQTVTHTAHSPMNKHFLDFEKTIAEIEGKIEELRHMSGSNGVNIDEEIRRLQKKMDKNLGEVY